MASEVNMVDGSVSILSPEVKHASAVPRVGYAFMDSSGDRIKTLREAKGWTQQELADRLATHGITVSRAAVSQWERGEIKDIKNRTFLALVFELGTTQEYILFGPTGPADRDSAGKFRRPKPA